MDPSATYSEPLCIGADHPSLPGHFPGNPIVPGVVVLDHVQQAAQRWLSQVRISGIAQAKFVQPLLPGQQARIDLRHSGAELRFSVIRDASVIAQGVLAVATPGSVEPQR
jgi:3-hydroxymyristoyl/3-hydroxydecanoyl-(acyl carrier protein) dehydratase